MLARNRYLKGHPEGWHLSWCYLGHVARTFWQFFLFILWAVNLKHLMYTEFRSGESSCEWHDGLHCCLSVHVDFLPKWNRPPSPPPPTQTEQKHASIRIGYNKIVPGFECVCLCMFACLYVGVLMVPGCIHLLYTQCSRPTLDGLSISTCAAVKYRGVIFNSRLSLEA